MNGVRPAPNRSALTMRTWASRVTASYTMYGAGGLPGLPVVFHANSFVKVKLRNRSNSDCLDVTFIQRCPFSEPSQSAVVVGQLDAHSRRVVELSAGSSPVAVTWVQPVGKRWCRYLDRTFGSLELLCSGDRSQSSA